MQLDGDAKQKVSSINVRNFTRNKANYSSNFIAQLDEAISKPPPATIKKATISQTAPTPNKIKKYSGKLII